MAHSLVRIKGSLVNTPHLIEQNSFNSIMEYVNQRIEGNVDIVAPEAKADSGYEHRYVPESKTGVMHVTGPMTYRTTGWEALCGGTSYEMLKEQMEYFVSVGAKTVSMMVDSGGGEAHAMMDSANYIRQLADENGIKIIAYVDGMSASAAYGISCIADEIVMSSDSMVGSIGVLIQLINDSKALEKAGYERTFVTAGKDKVPFAKDGSFTEAFMERLQHQVDALYEGFTSHVAKHRKLDVSAVKNTEANVFMADEALKLGLADKVMTIEEFYNYVADVAQNNIEGTEMGIKDAFKFGSKEDKAEMSRVAELETQLSTLEAQIGGQAVQLKEAADALAAATAENTSLKEKLETFMAAEADRAKAEADAKLASRKAALAEVVPETDLEATLANMSALDEGAFTFMVDQMRAVKEARAQEFKAVGQDGAEQEQANADPYATLREAGVAAAKRRR